MNNPWFNQDQQGGHADPPPSTLVFTVSKADPTGKEPTTGAVLSITGELPDVRSTLPTTGESIPHSVWRARCLNRHVEDAQQVVAALLHLPQGTLDQVLLLLLQQKASLLRVRGELPAGTVDPFRYRGTEADRRAMEDAIDAYATEKTTANWWAMVGHIAAWRTWLASATPVDPPFYAAGKEGA